MAFEMLFSLLDHDWLITRMGISNMYFDDRYAIVYPRVRKQVHAWVIPCKQQLERSLYSYFRV